MKTNGELKVNVAKISGVDDAILSLMYSKRTASVEENQRIRDLVTESTTSNGFYDSYYINYGHREFEGLLSKVMKYGIDHKHETLLSFIDLTIEVWGLHRGGMDDLDSHAKRFDNRIVRSSTRLASFTGSEKSNFYQGKILTTDEVLKKENFTPPDFYYDGLYKYVYLDGIGYIREDLKEQQDVIRGLYRLMIPCNCIFKINFRELRHVYAVRNETTEAHPELQQVVEMIREELYDKMPILGERLGG